MNLAIDLGNTQAKIFVFNGVEEAASFSFPKLKLQNLKIFFSKYPIEACILSSVIKTDNSIKTFLKQHSSFIELKSKLPLPIKIKYKTPGTLGNDRIAVTTGGAKTFPKKNVLVIDMGTCIKYDFVNANNEYLGGSISPGFEMRFKALNYFTQRLPLIKMAEKHSATRHLSFIGASTEESITTGVHRGIVNEMNGFAELYQKKFRSLKIILTGGDALRFADEVNFRTFVAPHLGGFGLNTILLYNLLKNKI